MKHPKTHRWLRYYTLWIFSHVIYNLLAAIGWARVRQFSTTAGNGLVILMLLHSIFLAMTGGVFYGFIFRRRWGWKLNFFFLALIPLHLGLYVYESAIFDGRYAEPLYLLPSSVIFGLILLVPNWIYFKKRKYLFDDGKGPHKFLFKGFRVLDSQGSGAATQSGVTDEAVYDKITKEMQENRMVPGVWTRSFAEADGDENRAKAIYIKLRVADLTRQKRLDEPQAIKESDSPKSKKGCGFWLLTAIFAVLLLVLFGEWLSFYQNQKSQTKPPQSSYQKASSENNNTQYQANPASTEKVESSGGSQKMQVWTNDLGGGVTMEFVLIPAGSFMMGSDNGASYEKPVHHVSLSQSFWMAKTEVTQAQYEMIMGSNPSQFKGANYPVEMVSWDDAIEFCRRLSKRLSTEWECALPTEAQWEYACRAGTTGEYAGVLDLMGWYEGNSGGRTHPVGTKRANAWSLHDMHGNVWEWCCDWYVRGTYNQGGVTDPRGASSGSYRVRRGGGWLDDASGCRSAYRGMGDPSGAGGSDLGFRPIVQRK